MVSEPRDPGLKFVHLFCRNEGQRNSYYSESYSCSALAFHIGKDSGALDLQVSYSGIVPKCE